MFEVIYRNNLWTLNIFFIFFYFSLHIFPNFFRTKHNLKEMKKYFGIKSLP